MRIVRDILKLLVLVPYSMWKAVSMGIPNKNGFMQLRRIRIKALFVSGMVYRLHIIILQSVFWYFFFGLTNDIWTWKWAVSSSLAWNAVNTFLYYNYHYWFSRFVKLGVTKKEARDGTD